MEVASGPRVENIAPKQTIENYRVGDASVRLGFVETKPQNPRKDQDPSRAAIFVGAWNWGPDVPIMRGINQQLADGIGQNVYQVDTKTNKIGPDSYNIRAEAIAQFVDAHQFKQVTLIGHSEGSIITADLAVALQKNYPDIKQDKVVLIDPVGMHDRKTGDLIRKFLRDPAKVAPKEFEATGVTPPTGVTGQLLKGLGRDIKYFGLRYPKELARQMKGMATLNPKLKEIQAPVLVLTGERDLVSDHSQYLPQAEIDKKAVAIAKRDGIKKSQIRSWLKRQAEWENLAVEEQARYGSKEAFVQHLMKGYVHDQELVRRGNARNEYLRGTFPEAKNIKVLVTSKGAHHGGLTDIRIKQAAHVASRVFEPRKSKAS